MAKHPKGQVAVDECSRRRERQLGHETMARVRDRDPGHGGRAPGPPVLRRSHRQPPVRAQGARRRTTAGTRRRWSCCSTATRPTGRARPPTSASHAEADTAGFLLATPNGTRDRLGNRFWNATDACCDWFRTGVDDVAYLDAVIDEIAAGHPVDPARVFLVGHSNGAFMSHRYACDRSSRVAAIVTLAGHAVEGPGQLPPVVAGVGAPRPRPQRLHGQVRRRLDAHGAVYPGAVETVDDWAKPRTAATAHWPPPAANSTSTARSTATKRWRRPTPAARSGTDVQLWTIEGGSHVPAFNENWAEAIWAFMANHPKAANRSCCSRHEADTVRRKTARVCGNKIGTTRWARSGYAAFGRSTPWLPWFSWS